MTRLLGLILTGLAALTLITMAGLFLTKLIRHYNERRVAFRSAVYISTLGEIVSRNMMPTRDLTAWAHDVAFHDTVIDFFNLVAGEERETLVQLTHHLDMLRRFHRGLGDTRRDPERLRSVAALAVIAAPESRPFLLQALNDPISEVRIGAAAGLSLIGDPDDVRSILTALEKQEPWAAERMADSIVRYGPSAVPILSNYVLIDGPALLSKPKHIGIAVRCLGQIGDQMGETAILAAIKSPDPLLRVKAAAALNQSWGERSALVLMDHLLDEDWRVRAQAATALSAYNRPETLKALAQALQDEAWWVRQNAATALGKMSGGAEVLYASLDLPDEFAVGAAVSRLQESGFLVDLHDVDDDSSRNGGDLVVA